MRNSTRLSEKAYFERQEKEHRKVEERIRKRDEKELGKWLKDFAIGGWGEVLQKDKF